MTISRTADQLAPLVPLTRYLYYHRLCDGMSLIETEGEWRLDDNPFIVRYYREFSRQTAPTPPDDEWFARATRRALLEERPDWVVLGQEDQPLKEFCQREGIGVLGPAQASEPESAWRQLQATPAQPMERPRHDPLEVLGDFEPPADCQLLAAPDQVRRHLQVAGGDTTLSLFGLSYQPELLSQLQQTGRAICIEPVNLPLEGASQTFRYRDYDNEFARGPADTDLADLLGPDWEVEILHPRAGAAGDGPPEAPDGRRPLFCARKGFARKHWLDRFAIPDAVRLKIVLADSQNIAASVLNHAYTINRYTPHQAWSLCTQRHPFVSYPDQDCGAHFLDSGPPGPELVKILEEADCFVFFEDDDETRPAWPLDLRPFVEGKAVVHLYIGYRVHTMSAELRRPGRQILTPLPHIMRMYPEADFYAGFPPATLDQVELEPPLSQTDGVVRVLQTPSLPHRQLCRYYYHKDTEAYLAAARALKARHQDQVEFWQVGGRPHSEILRIRQQTDITFNQLRGYHGLSGDEAMYLCRPMVQAFDQFNRNRHREYWGMGVTFPWRSTDLAGLEACLEELIVDPELRTDLGQAGRAFMLEYFSPRVGIVPLIYYCYKAMRKR